MGREVGGNPKREGTYVYLWPIHVVIWHNPIQYCKAVILQLKINFLIKGNSDPLQYSCMGYPMNRGAWWATVHRVAKSGT